MGILDRISKLLGNREQRELTTYLGLKSVAFSEWKSGKSKSYKKYLIEIADFFNVSLDYLVYGKEKSSPTVDLTADEQELFKIYKGLSIENKARVRERAEVLAELEAPAVNEPEPEEDKEIETIFIEYSTLRVSAGTGEPLIDDTYPEFIEVKRSELTEEANFAVKINGNSMLPHYKNNDIVLVRSQPEVAVGEIGIFTIDGEGYIKERGENRLISLNPEYDDIYFKEGQDIRCKGLVIGTLEDDDFV
ncbi:putative uncharacterized protein [Ruminococcus sp. CAG:624]|nr:putative uncharacterized protein [Ruminococcus sp. CAG:624]